MKVLVSESQYKLITEASKFDILVNKIGFKESDAEILNDICGNLSVWVGKRLYQSLYILLTQDGDWNNEDVKRYMKVTYNIGVIKNKLTSIMDWIRIGLNGNVKEYENLTFIELYDKSVSWHNSLEIGDGAINYKETNKVVRDYRKDGIGFYWVNLGTNDSNEECNRMGHCGRTESSNVLYSLRKTSKINDNYTINKSLLTAAIGKSDGKIYQMKGPKNSKPEAQLHPYIIDLILNDDLIEGFGSEYNSSDDFKLSDLGIKEVENIYHLKPQLFNNRNGQKLLKTMGVLIGSNKDIIEIDFDEIQNFIAGGWEVKKGLFIFKAILGGDLEYYYNNIDDFNFIFNYYINDKNLNKIKEFFIKIDSYIDFEGMNYNDIIYEYDDENIIRDAINWAYNDVLNQQYYSYLYKNLMNALGELGEVIEVGEQKIKLKIEIDKLINEDYCDDGDIEINYEECSNEPKCVLRQLIDGGCIDAPTFNHDERYEPDVDKVSFNEELASHLENI
jgi:hypothetical protein